LPIHCEAARGGGLASCWHGNGCADDEGGCFLAVIVVGAQESFVTLAADQKLTARCGHLSRFEAQWTISLVPSLFCVVILRDTSQQIG